MSTLAATTNSTAAAHEPGRAKSSRETSVSDSVNHNLVLRGLLTIGGSVIVVSRLAAFDPWIAGLSTFIVLMVVMVIVALRGEPKNTWVLGGVAAFLGAATSLFSGWNQSLPLSALVTVIGLSALAAISVIVCRTSQRRRQQLSKFKAKHHELERQLTVAKQAAAAVQAGKPKPSESEVVAAPSMADREFFDFAMLLLSMQQVGHRLSSELDLRELVSTILDTTQEVLHCRKAELFLWDARESRLCRIETNSVNGLQSPIKVEQIARPAKPNVAFEWVLQERRILSRRDVVEGRVTLMSTMAERLPTAIAPLIVGKELVGLLTVDEVEEDNPAFVRMLFILCGHCAMGLKNAQLFRQIEEMARRDSLTGLLNHRSFSEELDRLVETYRATKQPLTVVMGDVDFFKIFNDTHGHQAGDVVLQTVAKWWHAIMPDQAVLARYGGEEFICALPGKTLKQGFELAEMLRASLETNPVSHGGKMLSVTSSFGVAQLG